MELTKQLNERQKLFCKEYVKDMNGTQAAIRAGYSVVSARETASEILSYSYAKAYLSSLMHKRATKLEISSDKVLREFAKIAFIDIRQYYNEDGTLKPIHELSDEAAASLSGIEVENIYAQSEPGKRKVKVGELVKIKMHSKLQALENVAKHIGFYEKDNEQQSKLIVWNEEKTYEKPINIDNIQDAEIIDTNEELEDLS